MTTFHIGDDAGPVMALVVVKEQTTDSGRRLRVQLEVDVGKEEPVRITMSPAMTTGVIQALLKCEKQCAAILQHWEEEGADEES